MKSSLSILLSDIMLTKINPADKNLDFEYFVNLALVNKLPWDSLIVILNDWTPTLEKSKEVIEILVQELELWVSKVEYSQDQFKPLEASNDKGYNAVNYKFDYKLFSSLKIT